MIAEGNYADAEARLKASPELAHCQDIHGNTPLHIAAELNNKSIAQILLNYHANVNARNHKGDTPLHIVAEKNHAPVAQLLICNKADVNALNQHGHTPLYVTTEKDRASVAQLLIVHQGEVNVWHQHGIELLCVAAQNDSEHVGGLLVDAAKETVLAEIYAATKGRQFGLVNWDGDKTKLLIYDLALNQARMSGSHRMAACLHRAKASIHRVMAEWNTERANTFVEMNNRDVIRYASSGGSNGMWRGFAVEHANAAQQGYNLAKEEESAADSEIALSVISNESQKTVNQAENICSSRDGAQMPITRKQVLDGLKSTISARDEARRTNQKALVDLGIGIREHLLDIALDESLDHITRRHALRTASKFRDEVLFEFIRSRCLAGKSKEALSRALGDDEESHSQLGLFIAGEEILNTPNFYERFVAG